MITLISWFKNYCFDTVIEILQIFQNTPGMFDLIILIRRKGFNFKLVSRNSTQLLPKDLTSVSTKCFFCSFLYLKVSGISSREWDFFPPYFYSYSNVNCAGSPAIILHLTLCTRITTKGK